MKNIDESTVRGFGDEWSRLDQSALGAAEKVDLFQRYFRILALPKEAASWEGFDLGCGSGRWASLVAPRVATLNVIDASEEALAVARRNLAVFGNCRFHHASVDDMPMADDSQDFGYSLGVLHHVPDTAAAIANCVRKLKPGAPLLLYLYYSFDNRPWWFRRLWQISDLARRRITRLPYGVRYHVSELIAALVYWPLSRIAALAARMGCDVGNWPLSFYANRSFYVMRTDSLDRFGTNLEKRFSRVQIERMMMDAGLDHLEVSPEAPFWCVVGFRSSRPLSKKPAGDA